MLKIGLVLIWEIITGLGAGLYICYLIKKGILVLAFLLNSFKTS